MNSFQIVLTDRRVYILSIFEFLICLKVKARSLARSTTTITTLPLGVLHIRHQLLRLPGPIFNKILGLSKINDMRRLLTFIRERRVSSTQPETGLL